MVQSDSAYKLREAVTSLTDARIVVLELSEVSAIGGGGFGMLVFLQRWARENNIRFLLFNPSELVLSALKRARSIAEFYIPSFEEIMALTGIRQQSIRDSCLSRPFSELGGFPRKLGSECGFCADISAPPQINWQARRSDL